ncbi:MAG TPA: hypothetical protein VNI54_07095 [Thermoanaerobaculia bacterium]|nr:hypothetical protein [Thermoanaerobaculia bacterium]
MRKTLFCALAVAALIACRKEKLVPKTSVRATPTEAEARQFVDSYIDALYKPNVARATQLFDWQAILERATDVPEMQGPGWRNAVAKGAANTQTSLAQNLVQNIEAGGSIEAVRVRMIGSERRAIIRVLLPDGSLNYHEMPLVRDAAGFVRARDIYIYATGEYFSDMLRRLFLIGADSDPGLLERLAGSKTKNPMVAAAPRVREMTAKIREGDGKAAIEIYNTLPERLRKDKSIMLAYVMACSNTGDDELHARSLDDLRAAFPNDRGMEMMFIDANILRGQYGEALRIVDSLDRSVGGDPYLDVMRANIRLQEGDLAQAEAMAVRATERNPKREDAWWTRVNVNLSQKDFAETARLLTIIRDDLTLEIDDLSKYPEYAEFVKSLQYREFMR